MLSCTLIRAWIIFLAWSGSYRLLIISRRFFFEVVSIVIMLIISQMLSIIYLSFFFWLTNFFSLFSHINFFIWRNLFSVIFLYSRVIARLLRWSWWNSVRWWLNVFWIDIDWRTHFCIRFVWWFFDSIVIDTSGLKILIVSWRWYILAFNNFTRTNIFTQIIILICILISTILVFLSNVWHSFISITG